MLRGLGLCCFIVMGITFLYLVELWLLMGAVGEVLEVPIIFSSLVFFIKLLLRHRNLSFYDYVTVIAWHVVVRL